MKRYFISALMLMASLQFMHSQTSYLSEIMINNSSVTKTADKKVNVSFVLNLDNLDLNTQHSLYITPVVVSDDGANEVVMPAVIINGKTRQRVINRSESLGNAKPQDTEALEVIRRKNGSAQSYEYSTDIPFKRWMIGSQLLVKAHVIGCAMCDEGNETAAMGNVLPPKSIKMDCSALIQPEKEIVKRREEKREARLQFKQSSSWILPDFMNNKIELDKVKESLRLVKDNADLTIKGIYITGYASPEGTYDFNMMLSEKRAKSFTDYIKKYLKDLDKQMFHIDWKGEDWTLFREEVVKSTEISQSDKDAIVDVIDNCKEDKDECERQFRSRISLTTYNYILNELYPYIRRNEYRVEYDVRHFDIEEGKEMIKTRPDLMSVYEIYSVANAYPEGSPEYIECLNIGAATYPEDVTAVNNAAVALMDAGRYDEAISLLKRAPENASLMNLLGVAFYKANDISNAISTLEKAASMGDSNARANVDSLKEYLEYMEE